MDFPLPLEIGDPDQPPPEGQGVHQMLMHIQNIYYTINGQYVYVPLRRHLGTIHRIIQVQCKDDNDNEIPHLDFKMSVGLPVEVYTVDDQLYDLPTRNILFSSVGLLINCDQSDQADLVRKVSVELETSDDGDNPRGYTIEDGELQVPIQTLPSFPFMRLKSHTNEIVLIHKPGHMYKYIHQDLDDIRIYFGGQGIEGKANHLEYIPMPAFNQVKVRVPHGPFELLLEIVPDNYVQPVEFDIMGVHVRYIADIIGIPDLNQPGVVNE